MIKEEKFLNPEEGLGEKEEDVVLTEEENLIELKQMIEKGVQEGKLLKSITEQKEELNFKLIQEQKKLLEKLRQDLAEGKIYVCADSRKTLPIIERIKKIPIETLNSYPDIKENIVKLIVKWFNPVNPAISKQLAKCGLVEPEDYKIPLIQKIGKELKKEFQRFGSNGNIKTIGELVEDFRRKYSLKEKDLLENADIQNIVVGFLNKMMDGVGNSADIAYVIDNIKRFKIQTENLPEMDSVLVKKITQDGLIKIIKCLGDEDIAKTLPLTFIAAREAILTKLETNLKEGNITSLEIFLQEFNSLEEPLLISKFINNSKIQEAAKREMLNQLMILNRDNAEWIKENFLPNLDIKKFIINECLSYTSGRQWNKVVMIKQHFPECQPLYQEFIEEQKEIAQDINLSDAERKNAFEVLAGLAENGESSITDEFVEIIRKRGKEKGQSEQAEISESGFDNIQDGAFNTLLRIDNPDSNDALFSLLDNESIKVDVKLAAINKLTDKDRNFLTDESRQALKKWLSSKSLEETDWQDLRFIKAIQNDIPSTELKGKSELFITSVLTNLSGQEKSINQIWQENYSNIPENVFFQLLVFANDDEEVMNKFQVLYSSIKKEGTKKENLLYGIVNTLDGNPRILGLLVDKLKEVDFSGKKDADHLSEIFRNTAFLDKIDEIISHTENYNVEQDDVLNSEIEEIFSRKVNDLEELKRISEEVIEVIIEKNQKNIPTKEYPVLERIVNAKYSERLLRKFPELDSLSKENIKSLFEWKNEIMKQNPDIDPNSSQFRELMQEKIKTYKNNPETIEAIKEKGIDSDKWLNYVEEDYFILEEGKNLDFSKIIETPLNRINTSVFNYMDNIKESIKEFEKELKEKSVNSDKYNSNIEKIENLKREIEKSEKEGNTEKVQGMKKGLEAQEQKLKKLKDTQISSFEKIQLKIDSLTKTQNEIKELNNDLIKLEKESKEEYSNEIKNKLSKIKESLKKKFFNFKNGLDNFKDQELKDILSGALGDNRADSIVQEVEETLGEEFNHIKTDTSDLEKLFSEKQKQDKFESTEMNINVWYKNPDIDLYQGNYSPCCISIESGNAGNSYESTISDYLTESSIQIVNIVDKKREIPIVAAWCWLGKDKNGKAYFIVDNIEANTDYTNKYPKLLSEKLDNYIEKYAKDIGFKKEDIFVGIDNNDLKSRFNKVDENFTKIGNDNRCYGYYLEAENYFEDEEY